MSTELSIRKEIVGAARSDEDAQLVRNTDENGDVIFHFKLPPLARNSSSTLAEFYRQTIYDLLKIVRLYSKGQPVMADSFAFLNDTQTRIKILPESDCQKKREQQ
jgi:hypothetical protein